MVKSENIFFIQKTPQICLKSKSFNCIFPTAEETHSIYISWNLIHIQQARTSFTDVRATPSPPHVWLEFTGVTQSKESKDTYILILVQIYNISCNRHYSKLPLWRTIPKNIFFSSLSQLHRRIFGEIKNGLQSHALFSWNKHWHTYFKHCPSYLFAQSVNFSVLANVGLSAQIVIHKIT